MFFPNTKQISKFVVFQNLKNFLGFNLNKVIKCWRYKQLLYLSVFGSVCVDDGGKKNRVWIQTFPGQPFLEVGQSAFRDWDR